MAALQRILPPEDLEEAPKPQCGGPSDTRISGTGAPWAEPSYSIPKSQTMGPCGRRRGLACAVAAELMVRACLGEGDYHTQLYTAPVCHPGQKETLHRHRAFPLTARLLKRWILRNSLLRALKLGKENAEAWAARGGICLPGRGL